jgi:hypothetical protein
MKENENGKVPDFIGIGVQRSGTSWLYECLKEHPEIFLPQKEVHFFDRKYEEGFDWYKSLFTITNNSLISGEFTPNYLYATDSMERIAKHCPNAKLIIILRDPFDRAYSAYKLFAAHGRFENMSFEEAVKSSPSIIDQSLYYSQLVKLFSLFPENQIKIYDFEDISERPLWLLQDLFVYLGINNEFRPSKFDGVYNASGLPSLQNFFRLPAIQLSLSKNKLGQQILKIKDLKPVKKFKVWLVEKISEPNLKDSYCTHALRQLIKDDLVKTSELLNRNYERWY